MGHRPVHLYLRPGSLFDAQQSAHPVDREWCSQVGYSVAGVVRGWKQEYRLCRLLLCIGLVVMSVGVLSLVHSSGTFTGAPACKHAMQHMLLELWNFSGYRMHQFL